MDRIALVETYAVLSWDYGLYALWDRIERLGFRPSPMLHHDTLDDEQKMLYAELEPRAARTDPYARRLAPVENVNESGPNR